MDKAELIQAAKEIRDICRNHMDKTCNKCPFGYIDDEGDTTCVFFSLNDYWIAPEDWKLEVLERGEK